MIITFIPLNFLPLGKKAKVKVLTFDGTIRRRMLDLGLISEEVIATFVFWVEDRLTDFFTWAGTPTWVHGLLTPQENDSSQSLPTTLKTRGQA